MQRDRINLLVIANPDEPQLQMLDALPASTHVVIGKTFDALHDAARDADVLLKWQGSRTLFEQIWRLAPRVRWVHSMWTGIDRIVFPDLIDSPVPLTNSRGAFSESLAEFAIGAVLFFAKDFRRMVRSQKAGSWDPFDVDWVKSRTLGIVGYGDIGRAAAQKAKALGMKVEVLRRRPELSRNDPLVDMLWAPSDLAELLVRADYLLVAVPLTRDTRGLIGARELSALRSSAVIINVGRGPVIEEKSLIQALTDNRVRGVALDVFETEPLPAEHPFYKLENVLLSPHCADHTPGWLEQAMQAFLDNFERFRAGRPLHNIVDKHAGY
jgi:phosphoglycerate dehydrogenase-like enzyme